MGSEFKFYKMKRVMDSGNAYNIMNVLNASELYI